MNFHVYRNGAKPRFTSTFAGRRIETAQAPASTGVSGKETAFHRSLTRRQVHYHDILAQLSILQQSQGNCALYLIGCRCPLPPPGDEQFSSPSRVFLLPVRLHRRIHCYVGITKADLPGAYGPTKFDELHAACAPA